MPDALEYAVRPYQSPDAHGAIIIPSTPTGSREKATLTWGAKATMPEVSGINLTTACCTNNLTEHDRQSDKIRIYQDDDPSSSNWVDVERAKTMNLDSKEKNNCGDNWDDISAVAQGIDTELAAYADYFTAIQGQQPTNCGQTWNFKNQSS
jgi:hypothetical protein